ncbi:MAG: DUF89 family protein [Victivallales bacterium]|nr:DUF89 family protein [Victivallales bacterium]
MKLQSQCLPCLLSQLLGLSHRVSVDVDEQNRVTRLLTETLRDRMPWDATPAAVSGVMLETLVKRYGEECDLYRREKDVSTELAKHVLAGLEGEISRQSECFALLLRLAIGGNIIDFGIDDGYDLVQAARRQLLEVVGMPVDMAMVEEIRERVATAQHVFYILDNCGEAVFDARLLQEFPAGRVTLGVRSPGVLNDVNAQDLEASGLGGYPWVATGSRVPGVVLEQCSSAFRTHLEKADLVIAKGQGNFETLSEYDDIPVYCLFRAKCPVVCRELGSVPFGSLQIIRLPLSR